MTIPLISSLNTRGRVVLGSVIGVIVLLALTAYIAWRSAHPPIIVSIDSSPVTLELNSSKYSVKGDGTTLRPPKGVYNYKATSSGKDPISLYGTVDTIENSSAQIRLNYKQYTDESIKYALCIADDVGSDKCSYNDSTLEIKYLADHSWAIVTKTSGPDNDRVLALHIEDGEWKKVAGPVVDLEGLRGMIPDSVLEASK